MEVNHGRFNTRTLDHDHVAVIERIKTIHRFAMQGWIGSGCNGSRCFGGFKVEAGLPLKDGAYGPADHQARSVAAGQAPRLYVPADARSLLTNL